MMKQEDVLRELELLPVWQLRTSSMAMVASTPPVQAAEPIASAAYIVRCVISQDAKWLFVLKPVHSAEAETLFQNMLKAVSVRVGQAVEQADITALSQFSPKMIVVMGEEVVQQLLAVTQPLATLRGQTQMLNNIPVVATYAPEDLLENRVEKSKAWEDLCLAKFTIANL